VNYPSLQPNQINPNISTPYYSSIPRQTAPVVKETKKSKKDKKNKKKKGVYSNLNEEIQETEKKSPPVIAQPLYSALPLPPG